MCILKAQKHVEFQGVDEPAGAACILLLYLRITYISIMKIRQGADNTWGVIHIQGRQILSFQLRNAI